MRYQSDKKPIRLFVFYCCALLNGRPSQNSLSRSRPVRISPSINLSLVCRQILLAHRAAWRKVPGRGRHLPAHRPPLRSRPLYALPCSSFSPSSFKLAHYITISERRVQYVHVQIPRPRAEEKRKRKAEESFSRI